MFGFDLKLYFLTSCLFKDQNFVLLFWRANMDKLNCEIIKVMMKKLFHVMFVCVIMLNVYTYYR